MHIDTRIRMLFAELDAALRLKREGTTNVCERFSMILAVKHLRNIEDDHLSITSVDITSASLGDHC